MAPRHLPRYAGGEETAPTFFSPVKRGRWRAANTRR